MFQVGYAPVIVSITLSFCSPGKVERRNCSEIAITCDASFALPFVSSLACPYSNFKVQYMVL